MSWLWRSGSGTRNGWIQKNVLNPQKAASLVPAAPSGSPRGVPRCPCPEVGTLLTMIDLQVVVVSSQGQETATGPATSVQLGMGP